MVVGVFPTGSAFVLLQVARLGSVDRTGPTGLPLNPIIALRTYALDVEDGSSIVLENHFPRLVGAGAGITTFFTIEPNSDGRPDEIVVYESPTRQPRDKTKTEGGA